MNNGHPRYRFEFPRGMIAAYGAWSDLSAITIAVRILNPHFAILLEICDPGCDMAKR
jgi:hypothetical protein